MESVPRDDAVLVITAWREPDHLPSFRARLHAGRTDDEPIDPCYFSSHAALLDAVARWLLTSMPEN